MAVDSLSASPAGPAEVAGNLAQRLLRYFKAQVEDWCDACRQLTTWEDRNLVDQPTPDRLAEHAKLLDELEQVGGWLARATEGPDFPDRDTANLIKMTLQDLKDARMLWHGSMTPQRREEIVRAIFDES